MTAAHGPTRFGELNEVLRELVARVRELLGANLVGVYLQGSFALGDGDEHSDVDFVVVTHADIGDAELPALQALHSALHALPSAWAQHLEGSYAPASVLRRWSTEPRDPPGEPRAEDWVDPQVRPMLEPRVYPFLFLDNGARELVRSEHDNNRVVRWVLRKRGIALAGPEPRTLIDPVPASELRAEVWATMQTLGRVVLAEPEQLEVAWVQAFFALLYARMLHTLRTGEAHSKPAAVAFAKASFDERWSALVERAWRSRQQLPRGPEAPALNQAARADPLEVAATLEFIAFAIENGRALGVAAAGA